MLPVAMRVLLVEDHLPTLRAIAERLETRGWVVDRHSTAESAIACSTPADVALIDLRLGAASGIDVVRVWAARAPCLLLTVSDDTADLAGAFSAGASGYLLKSDPPSTVIAALDAAVRGLQPVSPGMTRHLVAPFAGSAHPYTLHVDLPGSRATLSGPGACCCSWRSEQTVGLLFALGTRFQTDGPHGWVDDAALATAIWGRDHLDHGANNLNVLIHRVRSKARAHGLEQPFLEKLAGRTRLVVGRVVGT
jgi:DNA-binding response OmpR family regulator